MKKHKAVRYLDLNPAAASGGGVSAAGALSPQRFRPHTELETLRILKQASIDKKLSGVVINTSGFSGSRSFLWEMQKAVEICKNAGKKIIAYFDNADLDLYCLVSAADKIVMDEGGILSFLGYSWGRFFAKETLDKLGIGFRELRYLTYKSANETFSRTAISEADKEQYGIYLDEIFDLTKKTIINNRPLSEESFNNLLNKGILLSPAEAKNRGLVDVLGREEAVRETIEKLEFEEPEPDTEKKERVTAAQGSVFFVTAGNTARSLFSHNRKTPGYSTGRAGFRPPEISVIHARGNTDLEQGMGARNILKIIREQAEKPRVKALIIRIDSPGGSAVAADYLSEAILEAKKEMSVVVSMGHVAASGGYWAAMNANHITASPYTLTGSIGVIGGWFFDKGLNAKLGLGFESLTRGEHADLAAGIILPKRDLSEDEEEQFRVCLLDLYAEFVKKAAKGRNMKNEDMEPLAQGRVYSGLHAQKLTLIDSLGGYLDAIETAKRLANIPLAKKIRIREYPKPRFFENITAKVLSSSEIYKLKTQALNFASASGLMPELLYRLSNNGKIMPVLPLTFM